MREIKFRFWNQEDNKMIYNAEETYDYGASGVPIMEENFGTLLKSKEGEFIMQYVGIKDIDGIEVYEGDIIWKTVEYNQKSYEAFYEVVYEDTGFYLRLLNSYAVVNSGVVVSFPYGAFYVTGNIYENPELLEEAK
jgi:uncharacterized phage protein (TIGR01671 family)